MDTLIPRPVATTAAGGTFTLSPATQVYVEPASDELIAIGQALAERLRPATGYELPVLAAAEGAPAGNIYLTTSDADQALGAEGYELSISADAVRLAAREPAGLFYGVQTLRQLLPEVIEGSADESTPRQAVSWELPAGTIRDQPRFEWRGAMLDVARHFFGVADVKRYIDLMAHYKLNRLHLHLSDDQGWRIQIESWPNLTAHGGSTQVGGGPGGFYTQADYAEIVAYAQQRYIMVVPEIDTPGHTNAALASYAELNCDGVAPPLYTGIKVGFSTLCADKEITYTFMDDVIRELAALTPGPYLHIGGDEASSTDHDDYVRFVERVQEIVHAHGKRMIGWEEVSQTRLAPSSVVQYWHNPIVGQAVSQGAKVIMSPADRVYLDMQYDTSTPLGLHWAAYVDVQRSYSWDPATAVADVSEADILGVEAPLWSETLETMQDVEYMAFPRLLSCAEIGWSPLAARDWEDYGLRLAAHGPRLAAQEVNFYRAKEIPWR
ncbi:MAG TPA: beta-N-acetylhexosaminidase [Roseiflexaceae bacterium]|nr:beta-N-acetylhexosaminidase [Roseiflexaceae bacterium]